MTQILEATTELILIASDCIKSGGLVVLPTSTNYNILCNSFDEDAVKRLFEAKRRTKFEPSTNGQASPVVLRRGP